VKRHPGYSGRYRRQLEAFLNIAITIRGRRDFAALLALDGAPLPLQGHAPASAGRFVLAAEIFEELLLASLPPPLTGTALSYTGDDSHPVDMRDIRDAMELIGH
jgi:hypothetical protein